MTGTAQLFEALMVIFFGISWPINILKSYRVRTTKGKSILFLILVLVGYYFGIGAKIVSGSINYVLVFYIINSLMVLTDILFYLRNRRLDSEKRAE